MSGVADVRETNDLRLLHVIRDRQPASRADLVKATGLRAASVSVIVNRLLRMTAMLPEPSRARRGILHTRRLKRPVSP